MSILWKITCQEDKYPGLWQRWFKHQCVAVGWATNLGYKLNGKSLGDKGWNTARKALKEMQIGDHVIVALRGHRVGRIGQITRKLIEDDQWDPLVPSSPRFPYGEKGRRVEVRWDLNIGPDNNDFVIQLPPKSQFSRGELRPAISQIKSTSLDDLIAVMNNPLNWVSLLGKFNHEQALSDYIANYSYRLEEGLLPYPDAKIRERVFKDRTRLDVLLQDKQGRAVIVECKQYAPSIEDIKQLQHYMDLFYKETNEMPRGLLVHGGAQILPVDIMEAAKQYPPIEIISYTLDVHFRPSTVTR